MKNPKEMTIEEVRKAEEDFNRIIKLFREAGGLEKLGGFDMSEKKYYELTQDDTTIMVIPCADSLEIYYRKPGYAYMFAFGLIKKAGLEEVLSIARANIGEYEDMFE